MRYSILNSLVLYHVCRVNGISVPLQISGNVTSFNLANPSTSQNLTVPILPPNFNLKFYINEEDPLGLLDVYLNAIVAMYTLAKDYRWDEVWPTPSSVFTLVDRNTQIYVHRDRMQLKTLHVVFGLYYTITSMSENSMFCQWTTEIYISDRQIGAIEIEQIPPDSPSNNSTDVIDLSSMAATIADTSTSNITTSNSPSNSTSLGIDIRLSDMTISYEFVGDRINSRDLFTAVLSGIADAAKAGKNTICPELEAFSEEANLAFCIFNDAETAPPLRYWEVINVLRSIAVDMTLDQRRFAEAEFRVSTPAGVLIAKGNVKKRYTALGMGTAGFVATG